MAAYRPMRFRSHPARAMLPAIAAALLILLGPLRAPAMPGEEPRACIAAAEAAARRHGVPLPVLLAIGIAESGRQTARGAEPWPWTVNVAGKGRWFATRAEAERHVARVLAAGRRSFDIGCFQINHRWHGAAFSGVREMFEPAANADYAARFLRALHAEFGDWTRAAGAYHSRTPEFARRYTERYLRILARVADRAADGAARTRAPESPTPQPATVAERTAPAPLARPAPASLVPLPATGGATRLVSLTSRGPVR